jgi:hypothetical protein
LVARGSERPVRIVLTFEGAAPEMGEPEEAVPARVLLVTGWRDGSRAERADYGYTWVEDHLSRLEGKEARDAYYGRLEG